MHDSTSGFCAQTTDLEMSLPWNCTAAHNGTETRKGYPPSPGGNKVLSPPLKLPQRQNLSLLPDISKMCFSAHFMTVCTWKQFFFALYHHSRTFPQAKQLLLVEPSEISSATKITKQNYRKYVSKKKSCWEKHTGSRYRTQREQKCEPLYLTHYDNKESLNISILETSEESEESVVVIV